MNFAWPHLLWLLFAPAGLLGWQLARKRGIDPAAHPKILRAEAGPHSLILTPPPDSANLPGGVQRAWRGARPRLWLCAGLALAIVALARPQWGRVDEPVFSQSREILLALDLSRSMLTTDVTPSRLARAKLLIQSLLDRLAGERVGLVIFSGTAFLQSPLSSDYEVLREFLPSLGPDYMPVGGTNYGALLDAAADAFQGSATSDRFLIILSDGGATDEDWRSHIGKLKAKGVRVIGLGIGTAGGGFIPDGSGGFMKDERGAVVLAKLESGTLRELAQKTGGTYRDAGDWIDLAGLLKSTVEAGRKGAFLEKKTYHYIERYQWVLAPALLCLLLSFWREFPVRPKPRDLALGGGKTKAAAALGLMAVLALGLASSALASAESVEPSALLGRMVGRLSAQDHTSALDWAELGQQTVTWGQQLQSVHQAVPSGPVRDALAAADAGQALDARAADWPKLRSDLAGLLKQPENPKQPPPPPQNQQQNNQQNQNQQQQKKQSGSPPQQGQQNQSQNQGNRPPDQAPPPPSASPAFGDMKPPPSPPPSGGMQHVGGASARKQPDPARTDPSLFVPLQKLDQVRNQDSPAELFQLLQNKEPRPAPDSNSKNW